MNSRGSLPSTPVGLVSSPLNSEVQPQHTHNREERGHFTTYDSSPQLDVLFELAEVLVQEIDIASGVPIYPYPQPSPLIISSVAASLPSSPATNNMMLAGGAGGAGSSSALLLLGNSKILLKEHEVTVIQISKHVFDIVFMERRFSATSPNSSSSSPAGCSSFTAHNNDNNNDNNPSSPMSCPFRFKCVRIGMPTGAGHTEDIEAFAAIAACYVGPTAMQPTEQTVSALFGSARLGGAPTQSFEIELRETLLTKGGGIGSHHHAMILSSSSSSVERSLVPIGNGGGGGQTTSSTSSVLASNVNYYGRMAAGYINKGTSVAVSSISKSTDVVVASTQPCQEAVRVPEVIKTGIEGGRFVAKTAADFTGGIASSLVFAANAVGSYAGSGIASALATAGGGDDGVEEDGKNKGWLQSSANLVRTSILPPVVEVGSAAISSGALVFSAVCDAQQNVLEATKTNLTRVVTHKLGSEVGEAAQGVMETAKLGAEVVFIGSSKKVKRAAVLMAAKIASKAAESAVDSHSRIEQERLTRALRPGGGGGGAMAITAGVNSAPLLIEGSVPLPEATSSLPVAPRSSSFDSLELRTDDCGAPLKGQKRETEGKGQQRAEEGSRGDMANNVPAASPHIQVEEITKEEVEDTTFRPSATSRSSGEHNDDYAREVKLPQKAEEQTMQSQSTSIAMNSLGVAATAMAVPETISRL